ncbi:hypothetical protein JDV02_009532 [Purpureocillium takamizusanense]|uniref:YCII-related domain-containing protein n=1 Tax=Purpureocillium takamizusanense TaxID=2060973 RepID=A0A9Q8QQ55_9HYPO|nr:uncharacterized protein JDV02_009532 [Purpureocillium takamizusanense]UNI23730.1 hypothetical protein JDV02_009532 [Purpureocillium takamizusanense]
MSLGAARAMASRRTLTTGPKKEFLCIMPDRPNVSELRKSVKGAHYEGIKPLISSGRLVAGGAMVESHPAKDELPGFKGSAVVYTGDSVEEVRKIIHNDVYATSGVWDLEKTQIIPYIPAVRAAMS